MLMSMDYFVTRYGTYYLWTTIIFFNTQESYISLYLERKRTPYTLPTHVRIIHEKVGKTLQHSYSKNTFNDQTTKQRLIQKLPPYPVQEHEVS